MQLTGISKAVCAQLPPLKQGLFADPDATKIFSYLRGLHPPEPGAFRLLSAPDVSVVHTELWCSLE